MVAAAPTRRPIGGGRRRRNAPSSAFGILRFLAATAPLLMMAMMSLVVFSLARRRGGGGGGGGGGGDDQGGRELFDVPRAASGREGVRRVGGGGDGPREGGGAVVFLAPPPPPPPLSSTASSVVSSPVHDGRPWRSDNCAVLSMASASGLEDHARFVGSLRSTGYAGKIILGISPDAPRDVIDYLESQNVTYHAIRKATSGCVHNGTEGAEPMHMTYDEAGEIGSAKRIIIDADGTGWNCPREYPEYKLTWARFFYYRDWLRDDCGGCTDGIMLTDFRDAYFQADPFLTAVKIGMDHPLLVFEEHPGIDTTHWLTDLPVMSCRKHKLGPKPMLCSGSTMGSRDGILKYLNVMTREFAHWMTEPDCRMQGYGDDQAVHNYLYYTDQFEHARAIPHRTGPIHVVGYEASNLQEKATALAKGRGLSDLPVDFYVKYVWQSWLPPETGLLDPDTGMIVNIDGSPSAQVHQYDRFGVLSNGWFDKMEEKGWPYNNATF